MQTVSLGDCIASVVDQCDGTLPVTAGTILHVTSDEAANGDGSGNTAVDIVIVDGQTVQLRAERDGTGDGRVYTIFAYFGDDDGNQTPITCKVQVPHDRRGTPAIDSGAVYCVGQGC
jgi:hypothetical protein